MSPGPAEGQPDPLHAAGFRQLGHANTMFGVPVLMGGDPSEACPKIGPGETLSLRVAAHATTEGGSSSISKPLRARVWLVKCKSKSKLQSVLAAKQPSRFDGNFLNCDFQVGDLEMADTQPIQTFEKRIGMQGGFSLENWTELPGGWDCTKPKVSNFITYAQNAAATQANSWYQHTQDGNKINEDWNKLNWGLTTKDAIRITHIGVLPHANLRMIRMYRSDRTWEYIHDVQPGNNPLPLPAGRMVADLRWRGPAQLPKSWLVWNCIGSIEAMDNGTSIGAWSATNQGFLTAIYGKKYELL
jgi:hypothetical protein